MNKRLKKQLMYQTVFWVFSLLILLRLFTKEYFVGTVDYIYTLLFHVPLVIVVYINYALIGKFISERRYVVYAIGFLSLLILGIVLHYFIIDYVGPIILDDFYFLSMPIIEISQYILAYLMVSLLVHLSKNWFELQERQVAMEKQNNKTQLESLKAQLNPHFLFNSLNNIYSITTKENKDTRNYLIKLSDTLRYMLYRTGSETVKLEDEINYIKNYIELEKLRLEANAKINFTEEIDDYKILIAPLILLPFIENCFKHCDKSEPIINIRLKLQEGLLKLECQNNLEDEMLKKEGGLGLQNAKKRLELLYNKKHQLVVDQTDDFYKSIINLKLNESA